ncbi:MAG: amidohydrolase family protein [Verrucomicrobia bacterium]|nr:amidohydrolase family protein [Verrucomicrobiota bacterium]
MTLAATGQERAVAFRGATIVPITGPVIEDGVIVVRAGRIQSVGGPGTAIPGDAEVHDARGKLIMPGLIDTHSHVDIDGGADRSGPIQAGVRILDAINVRGSGMQQAQAGGITTANIMPGSGHLISGQTLYIKLRDANSVEQLMVTNRFGRIAGGLKMANGTNSRRDPPFPGTRAKSAALVREKFIAAREYRDKIERAGGNPEKMPARDLLLESLVEVLNRERVVHHHTHRHDDILTVLRLQREFGFRVVLQHVSEGWKVADEIAEANVPCSIILLDSPGGKLEARDVDWKTGGVLERAGVPTAFHTDDPVTDSRLFLRSAAFAVRAGMSRKAALEGLTLVPARMLDLEDRLGSLEVGKDADFIVLSGDPLSVYTKVLETWVEGVLVFDRNRDKDHLWATGGYGAGRPRAAQLCCFNEFEEDR